MSTSISPATLDRAVQRAKVLIKSGYTYPIACRTAASEVSIPESRLLSEMSDRSGMVRAAKRRKRDAAMRQAAMIREAR